jgi:hypothetical protein
MENEPKKIRPDAVYASVYNEGLCAYLCDASHEAEILKIIEASPDAFPAPNSNESESLRPLAERGLLLTYELYQDDELSIQIAVGEPASEAERTALPMHEPVEGYLSLPSGRLLVHSSNTAPWSDPTDGGAQRTFDLPKGDYRATIYHIDLDRLPETPEGKITSQFVCLTPVAEKPTSLTPTFIRYHGT